MKKHNETASGDVYKEIKFGYKDNFEYSELTLSMYHFNRLEIQNIYGF